MYMEDETYEMNSIDTDSDCNMTSESDDEEFEMYLAKSDSKINSSIQNEIVNRKQKKLEKLQSKDEAHLFENSMEDDLDTTLKTMSSNMKFNLPNFIYKTSQKEEIKPIIRPSRSKNVKSPLTSSEVLLKYKSKSRSKSGSSSRSRSTSNSKDKKNKTVRFIEPLDKTIKEKDNSDINDYEDDFDENKNNDNKINDDLLYDPDMDEADALWVENKRRLGRNLPSRKNENKSPADKAPNSDAILDCPACLSTVCIDCQRHDLYKNQYRAMFVMNCKPFMNEKIKFPLKNKKRKGCEKNETVEDYCFYHSVRCCECNTEIGVYDKDEVYHFFNVLASRA